MSRFARRRDANHSAILKVFRQAGLGVMDLGSLSDAGADAVIWGADGRARLVEIKDGRLAPSQCKLTDSEAKLMLHNPHVWRLVSSVEDALRVVHELREAD